MPRVRKTMIEKIQFRLDEVDFTFSIGDEIKPGWDVMRAALKRIDTHHYQAVVPLFCDRDMLYNATKDQISWLVPMIVKNIDRGFEDGRYNIATDRALVAIGYVLVWYWHFNLGGPRPRIPRVNKRYNMPKIKWHADLRCPFCDKVYEPPKAWTNWERFTAEQRFKAWYRWLGPHAKKYHQWDV